MSAKRIAVCSGSFDPVTVGHIDIIKRASKLFDKVIVLVSTNLAKKPLFTRLKRVKLLEKAVGQAGLENVEADIWDGLLADYVERVRACAIIKGLRAVSDFEYEFQMALANKMLSEKTETVFLPASSEHMYLSSSVVKQIALFGGDISRLVPECILEDVTAMLSPPERR